jgi:hypothetical protein
MTQAPLEDAARRPRACGFLGIREHGIVGFACDPEQPHLSLDVDLLLGGELVASVRADCSEPELAGRVLCDGPHAFRFRLDRIPPLPCEIVGKVRGRDASFGPLRIEANDELANAVDTAVRYEGQIDELVRRSGRIHGWVFDRFNPQTRVRVTLRDWETPLLDVKADIHHPGLEANGKGDGYCAFAIRLPLELLDGKQHTLRVTVEDTNAALRGCPVVFEPEMARDLIEVIAPWREDLVRIEAALPRLAQLVVDLEAKRNRARPLGRLRTLVQLAPLGRKIKVGVARCVDLVEKAITRDA